MRHGIKGRIQTIEWFRLSDAYHRKVPGPEVIQVLRCGEQLKELDNPRIPAGNVPCELLKHAGGSLSTPVGHGICHFGTWTAHLWDDAMEFTIAYEVAYVGNYPISAGLNKLIVVELIEVLFQDLYLSGNH
jgi:hypothetical protein